MLFIKITLKPKHVDRIHTKILLLVFPLYAYYLALRQEEWAGRSGSEILRSFCHLAFIISCLLFGLFWKELLHLKMIMKRMMKQRKSRRRRMLKMVQTWKSSLDSIFQKPGKIFSSISTVEDDDVFIDPCRISFGLCQAVEYLYDDDGKDDE